MTTSELAPAHPVAAPDLPAGTTLGGHPRGLLTLFFTEMWERFSYYGMRALLVLYMAAPVEHGGLGFPIAKATAIYGSYTGLVYLSAMPGGYLADRFLGMRRAVALGGIIIASGHFLLAMPSLATFYAGLAFIICGTGLLKPNVSAMVGGLYAEGDSRRDGGFSIFYMGINLGGMIAPIACGFLAQDEAFLGFLQSHGLRPEQGWHFGFAAAGLGMFIGLLQFLAGRRYFGSVGAAPADKPAREQAREHAPLSREDKLRMAAIGVLFFFACFFWVAFEQAGSSLNLFADRVTDNHVLGRAFPSSWYQSINSLFIISLAPVFAWLWVFLGRRGKEPSSPAKFAWGLFWVGAGFLLVGLAAQINASTGARVSPMWLIGVYLCHTLGELSLSPVGLSTVTKLAPARYASLMMGVWFLSLSIGNKVGGWVAGFFDPGQGLARLFYIVAFAALGAAVVLAFLTRPIKRLMSGVN